MFVKECREMKKKRYWKNDKMSSMTRMYIRDDVNEGETMKINENST